MLKKISIICAVVLVMMFLSKSTFCQEGQVTLPNGTAPTENLVPVPEAAQPGTSAAAEENKPTITQEEVAESSVNPEFSTTESTATVEAIEQTPQNTTEEITEQTATATTTEVTEQTTNTAEEVTEQPQEQVQEPEPEPAPEPQVQPVVPAIETPQEVEKIETPKKPAKKRVFTDDEKRTLIVPLNYQFDGRIVGSKDDTTLISMQDSVYLDVGYYDDTAVGDEYYVLRKKGKMTNSKSGRTVGLKIIRVGIVRIIDVNMDSSTAVVYKSYEPILKGDLLKKIE